MQQGKARGADEETVGVEWMREEEEEKKMRKEDVPTKEKGLWLWSDWTFEKTTTIDSRLNLSSIQCSLFDCSEFSQVKS
ncbi:hypothetical protein Nepgr_012621 [Nepenthes gracilis]|uniref:Uncharacterized protein n=1 Tax=Nepenthes gracilis TaxID=150966 RepID=A0AAD3SH91_NEPGR|nr:hypothetical protein Nepgr_012621 [Nepenthes gracilis]